MTAVFRAAYSGAVALDDFQRYPLVFGPSPAPPARAADRAPRRCAAVGQAGRRQLRPRLRRQQARKLEYLARRGACAGLRHAGLDRRRAVEPHAPGRRRRRPHGTEMRARPGELGRLAGFGLRPRRQHPSQPHPRCGRAPRPGRVWDRLQRELGAGAGRRRGRRRQALPDPGRRLRPPSRRPRLRALGTGGGRAGGGTRRLLRHRDRLLGDRLDAGGDGRPLWPPRSGRAA